MRPDTPREYARLRVAWSVLHSALLLALFGLITTWYVRDGQGNRAIASVWNGLVEFQQKIAGAVPFPWSSSSSGAGVPEPGPQRTGGSTVATAPVPPQQTPVYRPPEPPRPSQPQARMERADYRPGDRHTYETVDYVNPSYSNVVEREVLTVLAGEVTIKFTNQRSRYERFLVYTYDGSLLRSRSGSDGMDYSPPVQYFQFPGQPGDTWTSRSLERNIKTGKTRTHILNGRIVGMESVTVPAGTFEAFKIVMHSEVIDEGIASTGEDISWYSPLVGRSVKSELTSRDASGKDGRRLVQLLTYSRGV